MNRLFFRPDQAGMTKTDAAAQARKFVTLPPLPDACLPACLHHSGVYFIFAGDVSPDEAV